MSEQLSAEQVLEMDDTVRKTVTLPEWDNLKLDVVSLGGEEILELEKRAAGKKQYEAGVLGVIAHTRHHGTDEPFFKWEHFDKLKKKNSSVVFRLAGAIAEVRGLQDEVEEAEKN